MAERVDPVRGAAAWKFARGNALTLTLLAALAAGCLVVVFHPGGYRTVGGLLWSMGFAAAGGLLGFLFAVPRPSRAPVVAVTPPAAAASAGTAGTDPAAPNPSTPRASAAATQAAAAANAGMEINTNLM